MAADLDAEIIGVMAASGSGKGVWLKQWLVERKPARLVIWDFKDEYDKFARKARTLGEVRAAMVKAGDSGPLQVRYRPQSFGDKAMRREFEMLCSLVQAWEGCVYLVEELSNVTMPSWAPPAWRMMTTGGRHEGITIIGVSQNPALIDKTFLSNCTLIHVGQLHEHAHRNAVEKSMDIAPGSLADLVQFQWIEKHRKTGEFLAGVVRIKGVSAPPSPSVPTRRGRGAAAPSQVPPVPATLPTSKPRRVARANQRKG